jgi:hypothetical protein
VAAVEQECCPFLSIEVSAEQDRVVLSVATENAEARPIVDLLLDALRGDRHEPVPIDRG